MRVSFAPAFLKQLRKLDPQVKEAAKEAVARVIDFYELRDKGLRIRVLYLLSGSGLRFVLAGTHGDVKRFLLGI